MSFSLMLFDTELLRFSVLENLAEPLLRLDWLREDALNLLPQGMEPTAQGLSHWLRRRTIPKNRAFVNRFLAKCGLNANRPMDIIRMCRGLSLNDSYWIRDEESQAAFDEVNLYDNRFSRILGELAFTGFGSNIRTSLQSSPEFTTNGMLPKCWRRVNGGIYLYKGATSGFSNTGFEPYSEMYASQLAARLGFNAIPYRLSRWKNELCSVCALFTSKEIAYVPAGTIVKTGGFKAVRAYYAELGADYVRALNEMIVFDALICNTDRHFGNFGLLMDSRTNTPLAAAPLFDHGNALLNFAGEENWASEENLRAYAETLMPCVYDDFIEEAKSVLDRALREKLRKALTISIKKQGRINLPEEKLALMSGIVRERAKRILA